MSQPYPDGIPTETGGGNLPLPSETLTGKEILAKAFMYAVMSVPNPLASDVDIEAEVWNILKDVVDFSKGAMPGEWLCFNTETGEIGMAYAFKGEYRIRPASVTEEELRNAVNRQVMERLRPKETYERSDDEL